MKGHYIVQFAVVLVAASIVIPMVAMPLVSSMPIA